MKPSHKTPNTRHVNMEIRGDSRTLIVLAYGLTGDEQEENDDGHDYDYESRVEEGPHPVASAHPGGGEEG